MFGHQDDQSNQQQDSSQIPQQSIDSAMGNDPQQQVPPVPPPITPPITGKPSAPSSDDSWQHPGTALESDSTAATLSPAFPAANTPILPPGDSMLETPPSSEEETDIQHGDPSNNLADDTQPTTSNDVGVNHTNNLIDIKQQALSQLSPLVGHLDQSPEEKFRTTMMMIQASDDQSMIQTAFEAAQSISDEKVRAQALLDVVNEINYFTQNQGNAPQN